MPAWSTRLVAAREEIQLIGPALLEGRFAAADISFTMTFDHLERATTRFGCEVDPCEGLLGLRGSRRGCVDAHAGSETDSFSAPFAAVDGAWTTLSMP